VRTSYRNSACPSVRLSALSLSRPGTDSSPGEIETPGFSVQRTYTAVSFLWANFVPLSQEIPLVRGHQRGIPLRNYYFTASSAIVRTVADRHRLKRCLSCTTSTADDPSGGTNIDDLEQPWTAKLGGLVNFSQFRLPHTCQEWTAPKSLEIDQDNLRMKLGYIRYNFNSASFDRPHRFKLGVLRTRASNLGTPLKTRDFCYCRLI